MHPIPIYVSMASQEKQNGSLKNVQILQPKTGVSRLKVSK
uniref:Uncharacterized protein n=1 Tax=Arundo donax TaxID=35708 RepID=A0A0A8Y1J7_ARUDO